MKTLVDFTLDFNKIWENLDKEVILKQILDDINKSQFNININSKAIPNQFGLYAFFIKPRTRYGSIKTLEDDWINQEFSNYPKIIKKRFERDSKKEEWIPFYIGKSEKVGKRILEHLNHQKNHATYGLKLKDRVDFKLKNEIKVGYWLLPENERTPVEIKQYIITNFEMVLRKKLNPWIGKQ